MHIVFWSKAAITGLLISMPIGPVNLLCIRRTLSEGRAPGLITGVGAAAADAIYACIAAFGLGFFANFFIREEAILHRGGGIFLCYLGIRILLAHPHTKDSSPSGRSLFQTFISAFLLTLANPLTILAFTAVFANLGLIGHGQHLLFSFVLATGVFAGALLWWLFLSNLVSLLRYKINNRGILLFNRISGVLIVIFGVIALLT